MTHPQTDSQSVANAQVVALQMVSCPEANTNLDTIDRLLAQLEVNAPTLVVLPECFACFGAPDKFQLEVAESLGDGPIQARLAQMAKHYGVWIVAGTMPIKTANPDKFAAACLLFNDRGEQLARYDKIHLFDVQVADNTGSYLESRYTQAGDSVVAIDTPFGRLGLAVCYDVRFPGLFQAMEQIDLLALPAAFTAATGAAHWHGLLQARSIEKQCYVVAANQGGVHNNGRETYGHSLIYSPWGELLGQHEQGPGLVTGMLDLQKIAAIRTKMPISQQNRFRSHFVKPS